MDKCFADNGDSCKALRTKNCEGCGFYKTKKQLEASKKKAMKRLKTLDKFTKMSIEAKYKIGGII
ncbi:hypothetical protein [Anaerosalibacter massiliensis]|uniref:Uncharacterized protein n=1 Tax=Anaerosalibacter massiliensis TaxID=1347392 RepID=A0A9X2MLV0_9FIRM|nr:hypothetical protein [Anaerosalibacter massiliensis]MCR2045522.1 hypothetical protein [Anaerosalibacter massiliensis]